MEERVNIKGGPKANFLLEKGLNESSKPQDWFNAFLPIFDRKGKNPQNVNTQFWTHKWAIWTNQKAISCSVGVPGGVYPSFTPFSYLEIERFLGLYILQGLNHSPQIEMEFTSNKWIQFKEMTAVTICLVQMRLYDTSSSKLFCVFKIPPKSHPIGRGIQCTRLTPY